MFISKEQNKCSVGLKPAAKWWVEVETEPEVVES